jgi:hypothetical protein
MAYSVRKVDVWTGEVADRAGGLASKLQPLAEAGADLGFVIARRQPHERGKGVVFVGPLAGSKQARAAQAAGLKKATDVVALQVEGPNTAGAGYEITRILADAGINLRGLSAGVTGRRFVAFLAFDSPTDAGNAARLLRGGGDKGK